MNNTPEKNPAAVALGALGGKAGTGKAKARTSAQASAAAAKRWATYRAIMRKQKAANAQRAASKRITAATVATLRAMPKKKGTK